MLRWVFSAIFGLATISAIPALAEDAPTATPTPVAAVTEPAPAAMTAVPMVSPATAPADATTPPATVPAATDPAAILQATAAVEPPPPPEPTLTVSIDLADQRMTVSEDGVAKYTWAISSGTAQFPTPRGTFRPQWTAKMWYSRKYDWAPMPHAVFINGGVAIHATYHTGALGNPASHGCIRLAPANAKTFYNLVHRHGLKLTRVAVHGTPKWRGPAIASRKKKPQQFAVQNESWFWGSPTGYSSDTAYNPQFIKKKYRAPKPGYGYAALPPPRAYRKRGSNKIVYLQQPPAYYSNNGW